MKKMILADKPIKDAEGLTMFGCTKCGKFQSTFNNKEGVCDCGKKFDMKIDPIKYLYEGIE